MNNEKLISKFSAKVYAIEKYNATHGNMYINGQNYILASQSIKMLKECLEERKGVSE